MNIFIALFILIMPAISLSDDKMDAVRKVVALYQDDVIRQTGNEVRVIFDNRPLFQAHAKIYKNESLITMFSTLMNEMEPLELVTIACHELGHILGEVRHANTTIGNEIRYFREAVEGEADYFAGSCLQSYLGDSVTAMKIASRAYQKLLRVRKPIDATKAEKIKVKGILPSYPGPECRLLTVIHGIEGKERPACWYNPE